MAPIHRVAIIQLHPIPLSPSQNFSKAASFIRSAALQGAKLAVLPEYHLTNWVPEDAKFAECCGEWEVYLEKYQELARELGICIVPGTIVERHWEDEDEQGDGAGKKEGQRKWRLENVAYFIDDKGVVVGKYVKKNLWGPIERGHLKSSAHDPHEVFDTPVGKVGMLICWDLAFPEAFRELIAQGAQIIIIPTFWTLNDAGPEALKINPTAESLFLDSILTSRVFENTCAIIFANAAGPAGSEYPYCGLSQVTVPFIGALTKLGSSSEGMSVVDIDLGILDVAERNYKVRADLKREDWHYSYRHDRFMKGEMHEREGEPEGGQL